MECTFPQAFFFWVFFFLHGLAPWHGCFYCGIATMMMGMRDTVFPAHDEPRLSLRPTISTLGLLGLSTDILKSLQLL